jgi:hypothetical protein
MSIFAKPAYKGFCITWAYKNFEMGLVLGFFGFEK